MKTLQELNETTTTTTETREGSLPALDRLPATHFIEEKTGKMPWVSWVGMSAVSLVASVGLLATSKKEAAAVVGLFAPCFLLMGLYNKVVELEGIVEREENTIH